MFRGKITGKSKQGRSNMKSNDLTAKENRELLVSEQAASTATAAASALQSEIDLYRQASARYAKRAKHKTATALCFLLVSVLITVALAVMALLAYFGKIEPLAPVFFYSVAGASLALLLIGLCFFAASRDDKGLVADCKACISVREERLEVLKKQIEEERRRAAETNMRVV